MWRSLSCLRHRQLLGEFLRRCWWQPTRGDVDGAELHDVTADDVGCRSFMAQLHLQQATGKDCTSDIFSGTGDHADVDVVCAPLLGIEMVVTNRSVVRTFNAEWARHFRAKLPVACVSAENCQFVFFASTSRMVYCSVVWI